VSPDAKRAARERVERAREELVAVIRAGVIQQVGTPEELYQRPRNLLVAGFIGSPAMNFLPGTLEDGRLRTALGDIALPAEMLAKVQEAGTGRDLIVELRREQVVARLDPASRAREGQALRLWFDPGKLHLFNPDNGAHLTL
jgi:ABC-type sugar transport system ATPase subunit